ncbi:hypothetical protein KY284_017500 [Solanum tuberosum]|nr:hypothetical protein KY284_017500 [Solanum tuberosum]
MAITKIDQNDPLYIGHSDTSGAVLIPIKLTGACTRALYKDELHEQWETCNAIVLSWLMNTVSEDLLSGIVYATTTFLVWVDLKERYDKVNRMRIYQLHREITTLTQVPNPSCNCPQSKDYVEHLLQMRLIQFLSGLNESYDQARRQILLKGTTPTINQAYAIIMEDEIQQSNYVANVVHKPDPMIINVYKNQGKEYYKGRKCEFCHFTGHTKENCYKLIGYPDD